MSFLEQLNSYPARELKDRIESIQQSQIDAALKSSRIGIEEFICLLSPRMDDTQLETLAASAHRLTTQRFGRTIQLYAPLYLSNECHNGCRYCGFSADNHLLRKTLNHAEIEREARTLHSQGFRHVLLLTGESPESAGIDYLEASINQIKSLFGSIAIEVFPLDQEGYQRMVTAGVDGLTLYQETYDPELYSELHPYGPKSDFSFRLGAPERAGASGFRRVGIGALLGLGDFLTDSFYTGLHALYLARHFWRTQITIGFPRIKPAVGGYTPQQQVSDRQLTQLICALRLLLPDAGLVLSTRESASLRNHLLPLGITQMSAGSCTAPGGYAGENIEGEQFSISDHRSPEEFSRQLQQFGYEAVWKDWDNAFLLDNR
ncbi:MAG: 2-iminoacetate synthase ThiH [Desulfuromonas sp.]|nr:MAG: 2-iminoacetate synthase ThiH [Desulfuromonas sp.]